MGTFEELIVNENLLNRLRVFLDLDLGLELENVEKLWTN